MARTFGGIFYPWIARIARALWGYELTTQCSLNVFFIQDPGSPFVFVFWVSNKPYSRALRSQGIIESYLYNADIMH